MDNSNQRFELDHDGNIVAGNSELCGDQGRFLEEVFSQFGWKCNLTDSVGCRRCFTLAHACRDSRDLIVYSGNIRNEARNEYEKKIQLGASSDPRTDPRESTIILGIYLFNKNDSFNDAILVGFPIRDDVNYPTNPSLRGGIKVNGLLQEAKIVGFCVDKSTRNVAFRPEFIFYYLEKLKQFHYSTNGDEQIDLDHSYLANWPKQDICDWLSLALNLFAEKRKETGETGWLDDGQEVNAKIREYFDPLTETVLQAFDDAKIEELFCGKKGADGKVELETMWSGKNGHGWSHVKPANGADTKEIVDFLVKLKTDVGIAAKFLQDGFTRPKGFGPSVISELLMKFHPESCIKHGERSHNALRWLGLIDFEWNSAYSEDEYRQVCGAAAKILGRMAAMKLPRQINEDGSEDTAKPDYLTVNEFLYFVDTNLEKIKEEIMSKAMKKPTTKKNEEGKATISNLLKNKEDSLMTMLIAGLLTKPLAILAGVSGTGKSRMVRHLAYKTCLDEDLKPSDESAPGNFKMVQVKPSWHDSADLLGYRSAVNEKHEYVSTDFVKFVLKAHAYPNTPFFVCLDEMNLAPVEHYFAEFLSACESIRKIDGKNEWTSDPIVAATDFDNNVLNLGGDILFESADAALDAALKKTKARIEKEGLFIPRNLFVVGTVNMDDSTGGFSRKVLDRAMTVVMNEVNLEDLKKDDKDLTLSEDNLFTTTEIAKFIDREDFDKAMLENGFIKQLEDIRLKLAKTPFALAYRFARETCMYKKALLSILDAAEVVKDSEGNPKKDASGAAIEADRACGDIALDHMILMKLLPRLTGTTDQRKKVIDDINVFLDTLIKDKKVSKETLKDMVERAGGNGGYLSFWP